MCTLYTALRNRGESVTDTKRLIEDMRARVKKGEDARKVLDSEGLESDYARDLLENNV